MEMAMFDVADREGEHSNCVLCYCGRLRNILSHLMPSDRCFLLHYANVELYSAPIIAVYLLLAHLLHPFKNYSTSPAPPVLSVPK